jgi:GTP-binding protein HflX
VHIAQGLNVQLTDTVGFIRNLPHGLVASFRSTLSVAVEADLLLVVIDASHHRVDDHIQIVDKTLKDIGADKVPSLLLLNKCDTPEAMAALPSLREAFPGAIELSAKEKNGLDILKGAISDAISRGNTDRKS